MSCHKCETNQSILRRTCGRNYGINEYPFLESASCYEECLIHLSLMHISEPTRRTPISYAVFCLKKKIRAMNSVGEVYGGSEGGVNLYGGDDLHGASERLDECLIF